MIEIRNDDVLQISNFSRDQKEKFREKTPFEYFLEADKIFEEYRYPCTLAVLSEGICEKEWVDYIKKNIERYKIELHGSSHLKYGGMSEQDGKSDLMKAKYLIEDTFRQKITTWYIPFGRKNIPEWGERVCKELGIKCDIPTMKQLPSFWGKKPERKQINFHYWDSKQVRQINTILKEICK